MCNLLATQGWSVTREFYYNDAGVQIATLGASVQARLQGLKPGDAGWPEAAYNGEYIADIAADFLARKTVRADDREVTASGDVDDLDGITPFAVAYLRHEQDLDLRAFGVRFDTLLPRIEPVHRRPRRARRCSSWSPPARPTSSDGALWLRTTDYGDDKDRVMRKSDGTYTYFVPDVAYHVEQVGARLHQGDQRAGQRPPRHHGARARRAAGGRRGHPERLSGLRAVQDDHGDEGRRRRSRSPSAPAAT